jgi:RND family efflux transporter MFP subunit
MFAGDDAKEHETGAKHDDTAETGRRELALREPQVRAAEVAVDSAESALDRARLDLRRTTLTAPFNALVVSEAVDPGEVLGARARVATLVGTDAFWVQVSVPVDTLGSMRIPGVRGAEEGSRAAVVQQLGEQRVEREGRVIKLLPELEDVGTMARVLVEVRDPLGLEAPDDERLPLLLGAYVHVAIEAPPLEAIEIPRVALREGDQVYVMDEDDRLAIRGVTIGWRREHSVLVSSGLTSGERIITSSVPTPVEGLELRVEQENQAEAVANADSVDAARSTEPSANEASSDGAAR